MTIRKANATIQNPDPRRRFSAAGPGYASTLVIEPPFHRQPRQSPDLHAAVDQEVDACDVGAVVGRQVERRVRNVLRLTEPAKERPVAHLAAKLLVCQF